MNKPASGQGRQNAAVAVNENDSVLFGRKKQEPTLIRTPALSEDMNEAGYMKAGPVLKWIDITGSEPALKHVFKQNPNGMVVTASLDRTNFYQPIHEGEMIRMEGLITKVWEQSLETQVKVMAENIRSGQRRDIATAYLVFVALDGRTREKMMFPPYEPHTREEKQLAQEAELRKKNRKEEGKVAPFIPIDDASDKPAVVRRLMTKFDRNAQHNVFGGVILSIIDEAGSQAAQEQALGSTVIGIRQDRMSFIAPTYIGETVEAKAIVTKTWNTSMEVQVEVEAINPKSEQRRKVASSYLVYVKLGPNGKPAEVPPFIPQTELQKQRAETADVRRKIREQEETCDITTRHGKPSVESQLKGILRRLIDIFRFE